MSNNNINNLNVFTFIKDIYQSLKHIDKCFNDFNTNINSRITKIEDNQHSIIDKINNIEILLSKQGEANNFSQGLDKNLENSLLEKITKMNSKMNSNYKIDLKPVELTFANILENNYNFLDINSSLSNLDNEKTDLSNELSNDDKNNNVPDKIENLNNLLFS